MSFDYPYRQETFDSSRVLKRVLWGYPLYNEFTGEGETLWTFVNSSAELSTRLEAHRESWRERGRQDFENKKIAGSVLLVFLALLLAVFIFKKFLKK